MGSVYSDRKDIDINMFHEQESDEPHLFVNVLLTEASNQLLFFPPSRNFLHRWMPLVVTLSHLLLDCVFSGTLPFSHET